MKTSKVVIMTATVLLLASCGSNRVKMPNDMYQSNKNCIINKSK